MTNTQQFDVFLAHNSKDKPQVRAIAQELKRQGLKPWIDEEQISPGDPIPTKVQDGLVQSRNFAFFIGLQGFGKFQGMWELDALIMFCSNNNLRVIPVLLPGVKELPKEQVLLASRRYLQFHQSINETEPLNALVQILKTTISSEGISLPLQMIQQEQPNAPFKSSMISNDPNEIKREIIDKSQFIFKAVFGSNIDTGLNQLQEAIILYLGSGDDILARVNYKSYIAYIRELMLARELKDFIERVCENYPRNEELQEAKQVVIRLLQTPISTK